jgi:glutaredoxin
MSAKSLFTRLGGIFRPRRPRPRVPVTLYTRPGCHLCVELEQLVRAQRLDVDLEWTRVDVDSSADLAQRYGERIPVLTVGGRLAFAGAVRPHTVRPRLIELSRRFLAFGAPAEAAVGPAEGPEAE